jgi:mono/diheme cytochrome c family protein
VSVHWVLRGQLRRLAKVRPPGLHVNAQRTLDAKGVFTSIADGRERNGIRMPEWRGVLSDKQIWEATAYVLSISQPSNGVN